jgi:hypothetical protein
MNANRNFNKNASKKPFCKVCHDAGKAESVYTSHCVKTYNIKTGKTDTTCPTLLALECRYCYKSGHTVKFCPVLEQNKKMDVERARDRAREQYHAQAQQQQQAPAPQRPKNAFAALDEESDDEQQQVQVKVQAPAPVVDEFPALMGNTRVAQNNNVKSYSCVAATPADERRLEVSRQQRLQQAAQKVEAQKKAVSWADEEDSEDEVYESEEEEEVKVVVSQYGSSAYFQPSSYSYMPRATADDDDW